MPVASTTRSQSIAVSSLRIRSLNLTFSVLPGTTSETTPLEKVTCFCWPAR